MKRIKTKRKVKKITQKERLAIFAKLKQKTNLQLNLDGLISAMTSEIHIDLFRLEKSIPNYDGESCMYKGKPNYSMKMALEEEYGVEVSNMISKLI